MVTSKSTDVIGDLAENHSRNISKCYLQNVLNDVGKIHDEKQSLWTYVDASLDDEVASIAVSIDGTCMYVCQEGYREAMVGTIALYDEWGERLHTTYIGEYPEYGKASFYDDMIREIGRYKVEYPHVKWAGIADGAKDNWSFLKPYVNLEILDFFHATGYLEFAAKGFSIPAKERKIWKETMAHELKNQEGKAAEFLNQIKENLSDDKLSATKRKHLHKVESYFENNLERMNYVDYQHWNLPIGSGVVEAAAKCLIKERMCGTGMKWKCPSATTMIKLRSLHLTPGRWQDFWNKISRNGFYCR